MTVFLDFQDEFPDLSETRTMSISGHPRLADGKYHFHEGFCADPACDCRRVMFFVLNDRAERLATLSFGFDDTQTPDGLNPFVEPWEPQTDAAKPLRELLAGVIERDLAYRARLERHYAMVKERVRQPGHPTWPAVLRDRAAMTATARRMVDSGRSFEGWDSDMRLAAKRKEKRKAQKAARKKNRR